MPNRSDDTPGVALEREPAEEAKAAVVDHPADLREGEAAAAVVAVIGNVVKEMTTVPENQVTS